MPTSNTIPPPPSLFLRNKAKQKNSKEKSLLNKLLNLNPETPGPFVVLVILKLVISITKQRSTTQIFE